MRRSGAASEFLACKAASVCLLFDFTRQPNTLILAGQHPHPRIATKGMNNADKDLVSKAKSVNTEKGVFCLHVHPGGND